MRRKKSKRLKMLKCTHKGTTSQIRTNQLRTNSRLVSKVKGTRDLISICRLTIAQKKAKTLQEVIKSFKSKWRIKDIKSKIILFL